MAELVGSESYGEMRGIPARPPNNLALVLYSYGGLVIKEIR